MVVKAQASRPGLYISTMENKDSSRRKIRNVSTRIEHAKKQIIIPAISRGSHVDRATEEFIGLPSSFCLASSLLFHAMCCAYAAFKVKCDRDASGAEAIFHCYG